MNCPYCGREMTAGYVQSARGIFFTTELHEFWFHPTGEDVMLSTRNWTQPACAAHHCKSCKKVIIDCPETKK